ncbi:MAG: hypothetical protein ACXAC7_21225 [Candidatus Hodarchaeales archaeon]|jgi:hypothetical protein
MYIEAHVNLTTGYSVYNVNASTIYLNYEVPAYSIHILEDNYFKVKFLRSEVEDYLHTIVTGYETVVNLSVSGAFYGDFLGFYGYDTITVHDNDYSGEALFMLNEEAATPDDVSSAPGWLGVVLVFSLLPVVILRRFKRK